MSLVLKIKFGEDNRRITVQKPPTFRELNDLLLQLFPNLSGRSIVIKYLDEDGDLITITQEMELKEAVAISQGKLKLFLYENGAKNEPKSSKKVNGKETKEEEEEEEGTKSTSSQSLPFDTSFLAQFVGPQAAEQLKKFLEQACQQGNESVEHLTKLFNEFGGFHNQQHQQQQQHGQQTTTPPSPQEQFQQFMNKLEQSAFMREFLPQLMASFAEMAESVSGNQTTTGTATTSATSASLPTEPLHPGIVCDGCEQNIRGIRYKCSSCPDYDLCQACEQKGDVHDPSHVFLKIVKPLQTFGGFGGRGCPYRRRGGGGGGGDRWNRGVHRGWMSFTKPHPVTNYLARFVSDISIDDGAHMMPEQNFVKIWKMRNEGSVAWPEGARLAFVGGDKLSDTDSVAVPPVEPGCEVDIPADMKAPEKPGRYVGYWRLASPDGTRFGQRLWVDIVVVEVAKQSEEEAKALGGEEEEGEAKTMEVEPSAPEDVEIEDTTENVAEKKDEEEERRQVEEELTPEMRQLLDMGFEDKEKNAALLAKHKGDVIIVVQELLNH